MSNISLKEMAALLDVSERYLKQSMIMLGMNRLQSEAERIQGVESWDKGTVAETFHLRGKPEIKHFKQALINLTQDLDLN